MLLWFWHKVGTTAPDGAAVAKGYSVVGFGYSAASGAAARVAVGGDSPSVLAISLSSGAPAARVKVGGDGVGFVAPAYVFRGRVLAGGEGWPRGVALASGQGRVVVGGSSPVGWYFSGSGENNGVTVGGDGWGNWFGRDVSATISGGVKVGGDAWENNRGTSHRNIARVVVGSDGTPIGVSLASGIGWNASVAVGGPPAALSVYFSGSGENNGVTVGGDAWTFARGLDVSAAISGGVKVGGDGVTALKGHAFGNAARAVVGGDAVATGIVRGINWANAGRVRIGGDGVGKVTLTRVSGGSSFAVQVGVVQHRGPTNQTEILNALRDWLISHDQFTDSTVYVATDPADTNILPPADQFCAVFPGHKTTQNPPFDGAGVNVDLQTEVFEIRLYSRLALDQAKRATQWTANRELGAYRKARSIANVLHGYDLTNSARTIVVAEPIRVQTITDPAEVAKHPGWGRVSLMLEVTYKTDFGT